MVSFLVFFVVCIILCAFVSPDATLKSPSPRFESWADHQALAHDHEAEPQLRACLRGRSYRQRLYSPERLLYPMGRVGRRGEGKFKRISWDEALDYVAGKMIEIRNA